MREQKLSKIITVCFLCFVFFMIMLVYWKQIAMAKTPAKYWCTKDDYTWVKIGTLSDGWCCFDPLKSSDAVSKGGLAHYIQLQHSSECSDADADAADLRFYSNESACTYGLKCSGTYIKMVVDRAAWREDDVYGCFPTSRVWCKANYAPLFGYCDGFNSVPGVKNYCYSPGESEDFVGTPGGCSLDGVNYCNSSGQWQKDDPGITPPGGGSSGPVSGAIPEELNPMDICAGEQEGGRHSECCSCVSGNESCSGDVTGEGVWTELGCISPSQHGIAIFVMRIFFGIVTALAVVRFIQAGILLNSDEPEKIKEGKSIAVSALFALAFAALLPIFLSFFGVNILNLPDLFNVKG